MWATWSRPLVLAGAARHAPSAARIPTAPMERAFHCIIPCAVMACVLSQQVMRARPWIVVAALAASYISFQSMQGPRSTVRQSFSPAEPPPRHGHADP